jgi:tetratricopeptide (TPR) repeat protein
MDSRKRRGRAVQNRLEAMKAIIEARPRDPRARFGLALEFERLERWDEAVEELTAYLGLADDEGNAYGRLAHAYRQIGREQEARDAYRRGIEAAYRHGHPTMAIEFEESLDEMG